MDPFYYYKTNFKELDLPEITPLQVSTVHSVYIWETCIVSRWREAGTDEIYLSLEHSDSFIFHVFCYQHNLTSADGWSLTEAVNPSKQKHR